MVYHENCPFCNPNNDVEQNIIFENKTCYFLQHNNQQEVLEGCTNAFELTKEEWNDTYDLLKSAKKYIDEKFTPDGYTLGWNVG
jgi:diadenosine tetraphosphate (Ap4A) HIT family hydrolase